MKGLPVAAGILIESCLLGILALGDLKLQMPLFFILFGIAHAAYLTVLWRSDAFSLRFVFAFGVLFRATLLLSDPSLSDDIYRYLWDGRVQAAGINPYRYAPNASELAHLRESSSFLRVNHPDLPTIYPPLAQALFRAGYGISSTVWGIKALLVGLDLVAGWFLVGLLRVYALPPGRLLIYLWNPLLVVEVSGSGHIDMLGVAWMVFALFYLGMGGYGRAMGALACSVLSKFFAICLVPVFWRWICAAGPGQPAFRRLKALLNCRKLWPVLVFGGIVGVGYLPYAGVGWQVFGSLPVYSEHWEFNALVFPALQHVLGSGMGARVCIVALFGGAVLVTALGHWPPIRVGCWVTGAFLLLTPTLHPWYAIWILPFLVFYPRPAWLVFVGLVPLAYHVQIQYARAGVWAEAPWVKGVIFGGMALTWAAIWLWTRWRHRV